MDEHKIPSTSMKMSAISAPKEKIESKKDASLQTNTSQRDAGCPYCEIPGLRRRRDVANNCSPSCHDSVSEDLEVIDLHSETEHADEHASTLGKKRKKRCHPDLRKSSPKINPSPKKKYNEHARKTTNRSN